MAAASAISAEGQSLKRVQFYEANNLRTPARIRLVLGWDDPKAELDLHIITPDGQHAFWAHSALTNGGELELPILKPLFFIIRYVSPPLILIVMLKGLGLF